MSRPRVPRRGLASTIAACTWLFVGASPVHGAEETPSAECLECHADDDSTIEFADGSKKVVTIDETTWKASVHGGRVNCVECHRNVVSEDGEAYPHPAVEFKDDRDYSLDRAKACRSCHYAYYTRALDGIHFKALASGNRKAPTCVDCHGAHDTKDPGTPRTEVSKRCAPCHQETYSAYANSVHGKALSGAGSPDVPVCTDCHGAHDIADPHSNAFHVGSYKVCARCHGDAERMKPYGLNPDVVTTYLEDFHGMSNQLYAAGAGRPGQPIATCTDCHGIHDIQKFRTDEDKAAMRTKVSETCRKCHPDADPAFADAWLSHYTPTWESAPLVWLVKATYQIMIPLIMLGLVLHILLHLWRLRMHQRS